MADTAATTPDQSARSACRRPPSGVGGALALLFAIGTLLAPGSGTARETPPRVVCKADDAGSRCVVSRLPPIVADEEVASYLRSGLTTTLLLTLSTAGGHGKQAASVRIEVRYEPWDEVYYLLLVQPHRHPRHLRLGSAAELHEWWAGLSLVFHAADSPRGRARLEATLIPFSEEEAADTRRWYAEALRTDRRPIGEPRPGETNPGRDEPPRVQRMLDALTLTSIKRHGVLRFDWKVPIEGSQ